MLKGNALRRSRAANDTTVVNNLPGRYPVEDWLARYWTVTESGELEQRQVTIQLPRGYAGACLEIEVGYNGCIDRVRRWGVTCYISVLNDIGFDPQSLLTHDRVRFPGGDDQEIIHVLMAATHFDLPGHFVIASPEHPFLLFAPDGCLKGSYTRWWTYLGALAYLTSGGAVSASFLLTAEEAPSLYRQALGYLLDGERIWQPSNHHPHPEVNN